MAPRAIIGEFAPHTCKGFVIHIATIVVGLFLAVALEPTQFWNVAVTAGDELTGVTGEECSQR
jgi:hypothetical protein